MIICLLYRYIFFLLHLTASIGYILECQNIHVETIPQRVSASLENTQEMIAYITGDKLLHFHCHKN